MVDLPKRKTDLNKQLNYEKIIKLFTNKHSKDLHERQIAVVKRVCRHNPEGFKICELHFIQEVITLVNAKVAEGHSAFVPPLCGIIELCGKPFIRVKANEECLITDVIKGALVELGKLLHSKVPAVQLSAATALREIAKGKDPLRSNNQPKSNGGFADDLRATPRQFNQQLLNSSGVVDTTADALHKEVAELFTFDADGDGKIDESEMIRFKQLNDADAINDNDEVVFSDSEDDEPKQDEPEEIGQTKQPPYFLISLMKTLREFSYHPANAARLTLLNVIPAMVKIVGSIVDFHEDLLLITMEVLWNILEHCVNSLKQQSGSVAQKQVTEMFREANAVQIIGKKATLQVLHDLMRRILQGGHRMKDKELRNEVLIISTIIAGDHHSVKHFLSSGYLELLLTYSTASDLGTEVDADVHNFGTNSPEDFEMKQSMWFLLSMLAQADEDNLKYVTGGGSRLYETLLLYINPTDVDGQPAVSQSWAPTQMKALQMQALSLLTSLVPLSPDEYRRHNGNEIVLNFLQMASSPNVLKQSAPDMELQHQALRLLHHTCTLGDFQSQLGELGAIEVMLRIFNNPENPTVMRRDAISVISHMCSSGHEENQTRFRRANGVESLIPCLSYIKADAVSNNFLIVASVGCVWNAVVGCRRSEARLLHQEGIDSLLDLLEVCPVMMRNQVLGVLADLCRNPKATPFFRAWKSEISMKGASQLLLALWLEEEERLGVPRLNQGMLNNLDRPLDAITGDDEVQAVEERQQTGGAGQGTESPAFARLKQALIAAKGLAGPEKELREAVASQDMRCKIYAVLASLEFDEAANELGMKEQMTLACAEKYPDFRKGQLWLDVKAELQQERIAPISADAMMMETMLEEAFNTAMMTKCTQKRLLDEKLQQDKASEQAFFNSILLQKEQELQAQLLMKKARMSKTSMKSRLESKQKKAEMLKKSLITQSASGAKSE